MDSVNIARRPTLQARVGHVIVGSDAPVVVQSMTNTDTADVAATVRQVMELAEAGSELVRITVNSPEARPRWRKSVSAWTTPAVRFPWSAISISMAIAC